MVANFWIGYFTGAAVALFLFVALRKAWRTFKRSGPVRVAFVATQPGLVLDHAFQGPPNYPFCHYPNNATVICGRPPDEHVPSQPVTVPRV